MDMIALLVMINDLHNNDLHNNDLHNNDLHNNDLHKVSASWVTAY